VNQRWGTKEQELSDETVVVVKPGAVCFRIVVASTAWSPYIIGSNKITHHFQAVKFNGVHFFPISSFSRPTRRGVVLELLDKQHTFFLKFGPFNRELHY
jgi:hypothetical protein